MAAAAAASVLAFLLPLGRPRPLFGAAAPLNRTFACCSLLISRSICAIKSLSAKRYLHDGRGTLRKIVLHYEIDRQRQLFEKAYNFAYSPTNLQDSHVANE